MRRSPWLPVLILLALGVYALPKGQGELPPLAGDHLAVPTVTAPKPLPADVQQLFSKSRAASVRVEQRDSQGNLLAIGSGFFINAQGQFLTAYHVVEGGRIFSVKTVSGRSFFADMVGFDNAADLALLKIRSRGQVPFLPLAERSPRVGERVLAIGNSHDQFLQPRRGSLLRLNATAERADFPEGTLEMSAPLAPGDSGGPILGPDGRAIGVVSYIRVDDNDQTLTSYAVPVSAQNNVLRDLRAGVKRDVPALGVTGSAHGFSYGQDGVPVGSVTPGGPAARAGLRGERPQGSGEKVRFESDVILKVDGERVSDFNDLVFQVRRRHIGETVTLTVRRGDQTLKLPVKLAAKGSFNHDGE